MRISILVGSLLVGGLWLALASACSAQGGQYTSPGGAGPGRGIPDATQFEDKIEDARWNFGSLRVSPALGFDDAAFVSSEGAGNGADGDDDFTATFTAGVRAYLRSSSNVVFTGHVLPSYVFWQDNDDKSHFGGRYGAGLFGFFNRAKFQLSYQYNDEQTFFSDEVQELTSVLETRAIAAVEVEVLRNLWITARGSASTFEAANDDDDVFFRSLDRDSTLYEAEIAYKAPDAWSLAVLYRGEETDFADEARDLDNTSDGLYLGAGYEGNRLALYAEVGRRELEPDGNSQFPSQEETVGQVDALLELGARSALLGYARRDITYSTLADRAYFLDEAIGARLQLSARKVRFGVLAEVGENDYQSLDPLVESRVDDVISYGADLTIPLGDLFIVSFNALYSEFDSNQPEFDRDVTTWGVSVRLGSIRDRLQLGSPADEW
ncbi:MAG: hypothetical protein AAGD38_05315 [Acidobacteriota bacterium]